MNRRRRKRPGRNDPCHCGSGKKFKHCHGEPCPVPISREPLPAEVQLAIAQHHAKESLRKRQQGLGKPIIGIKFKGYQFVAIGNTMHWGKWKTFIDFLSDYIKKVLGDQWGNAEIAKPLAERHPILQWYDAVCRYQAVTIKEPGNVHSAPATGAVAAYYGLAYNLYLLAHNVELQTRLIARLKNKDQFHGAYYECLVAACFVLAGFDLVLENEDEGDTTHCEFTATHKQSHNQYSVEAKSRASGKAHADVGNQLYEALRKTASHARIVLIDVNLPDDPRRPPDSWLAELVSAIKSREAKLTINGAPAPPAFVIVTNHPYHYDLEGTGARRAILGEGFKIPDFGYSAGFASVKDAFKAMRKYGDLFELVKTFREYSIPTTFDGEVPEFAFGEAERRFVIGQTYDLSEFEAGATGVLTTGLVSSEKRVAHLGFALSDGRAVTMQASLSEAEVAAYQSHPETFFGSYVRVGGNIRGPLDLFEFFYRNYRETPQKRILELMEGAPDADALAALSHDELVLTYCERLVAATMAKTDEVEPKVRPDYEIAR